MQLTTRISLIFACWKCIQIMIGIVIMICTHKTHCSCIGPTGGRYLVVCIAAIVVIVGQHPLCSLTFCGTNITIIVDTWQTICSSTKITTVRVQVFRGWSCNTWCCNKSCCSWFHNGHNAIGQRWHNSTACGLYSIFIHITNIYLQSITNILFTTSHQDGCDMHPRHGFTINGINGQIFKNHQIYTAFSIQRRRTI